jgi:nicotinamidase-related amidase
MLRVAAIALGAASLFGADLKLPLRARVEAFKGSGDWQAVRIEETLPASGSAILICDMWDKHWCSGATRRVDALAHRMAPVIERARAAGIHIIHAPSDVMDFYREDPHRQRILRIAPVAPPASLALSDPPLPIDDSKGGCDTGETTYKAWTREHPLVGIGGGDVISDKGTEVYGFLREQGIRYLLVMGVHTNMCVLNRTFAIKQMTRWGIRCVLVRDLTDAMYDPKERPWVSHERGTELVIEHIEKYWCPTATSADLLRAIAAGQ